MAITHLVLPKRRGYLRAIGVVATRHAQLDHMLRMTVKTVTDSEVHDAMLATHRAGSADLRKRVLDLARKRFGDGVVLIRLQALMERARELTEQRNELMHTLCEQDAEGTTRLRTAHHIRPLPSVREVNDLAEKMFRLALEINTARRRGFIHEATQGTKPPA